MRQFHSSLLAILLLGIVASCADTPIPTNRYEEHAREFIKEFGTPAEGHDYSMATTAGLQVKASKPTHITVTGMYDNEEYLFADLTVPAGITPVPVTIPNTMGQLLINIGLTSYTVSSDAVFDLDNPGKPSRGVTAEYNSLKGILEYSQDAKGNPIIAFKYSDFLQKYLTTPGAFNTNHDFETFNGLPIPNMETVLFAQSSDKEDESEMVFDLFPVFWKTLSDANGSHKDYKVFIQQDLQPFARQEIQFGGWSQSNPFPELGYSTTVTDVENIDFTKFTGFNFNTSGEFSDCFNGVIDEVEDFTIVSKGATITVKGDNRSALSIDLHYDNNGDSYTLSSSEPYANYCAWGDNYYRTFLTYLNESYGTTRRVYLMDKSVGVGDSYQFTIYDPTTGTTQKKTCGNLPFLLGYAPAALETNQEMIPESPLTYLMCKEVVFLVIPHDFLKLGTLLVDPPKSFAWTVAAEDLGGQDDWDFNDVVFTFIDEVKSLNSLNVNNERTLLYGPNDAVPFRQIRVYPHAAGGTLPVYLTYNGPLYKTHSYTNTATGNDYYYNYNQIIKEHIETNEAEAEDATYIIGYELHQWLKKKTTTPYDTPINVDGARDVAVTGWGNIKQFLIPTDINPTKFDYPFTAGKSENNKPLMGFAILVDRDNKIAEKYKFTTSSTFTKIDEAVFGQGTYTVAAPRYRNGSTAPQMLLIPDPNAITMSKTSGDCSEWQWPAEGQSIADAYPLFNSWISTNASPDWHKTFIEKYITKKIN